MASLGFAYFAVAALISVIVNVLYLTSPIYLTQVYQRVLPSQSLNTLVALTAIMMIAYAVLSVFDRLRSWVFARLATRIDVKLAPEVLEQQLGQANCLNTGSGSDLRQIATDLDQLRRFFSGPAPGAFIDLPLVGLYVFVLYVIHPLLGLYASLGVGLILSLAVLGFLWQSGRSRQHSAAKLTSYRAIEKADRGRDMLRAHGLAAPMAKRLTTSRFVLTQAEASTTAATQSWAALSKAIRLILQSGVLALAAYLVLQQLIAPVLIFACMVLLGRVMAPIDILSNGWSAVLSSYAAWRRIETVLKTMPRTPQQEGLALATPQGQIRLQNLSLSVATAQGEELSILSDLNADFPAGELIGLIGPSGAGKSSLLRLIAGVQAPSDGRVLYDGLEVQGLRADQKRHLVSWSGQSPVFLPGTLADNISGFDSQASGEALVSAARLAKIHDRIARLPLGYQTPMDAVEAVFSGGEIARVSLARALYGPPKLILLDEPTVGLEVKLRQQIAASLLGLVEQGHTIFVASHDPILMYHARLIARLSEGKLVEYGRRDDVLGQMIAGAPTAPAPTGPAPTGPAPAPVVTADAD